MKTTRDLNRPLCSILLTTFLVFPSLGHTIEEVEQFLKSNNYKVFKYPASKHGHESISARCATHAFLITYDRVKPQTLTARDLMMLSSSAGEVGRSDIGPLDVDHAVSGKQLTYIAKNESRVINIRTSVNRGQSFGAESKALLQATLRIAVSAHLLSDTSQRGAGKWKALADLAKSNKMKYSSLAFGTQARLTAPDGRTFHLRLGTRIVDVNSQRLKLGNAVTIREGKIGLLESEFSTLIRNAGTRRKD